MIYSLLADIILIIHLTLVLFVLFGLVLVLIGVAKSWNWVRNPWFRWGHLLTILIVASESWLNVPCPLTVWESDLRKLAGDSQYVTNFVAYWLDRLLFYRAPEWVFTVIYSGFLLLVVITFLRWPPRPNKNDN